MVPPVPGGTGFTAFHPSEIPSMLSREGTRVVDIRSADLAVELEPYVPPPTVVVFRDVFFLFFYVDNNAHKSPRCTCCECLYF